MYINDKGEKIIVRNIMGNSFLEVNLAGITYPNPSYKCVRNMTKDTVYDYYVFEYVVKGVGHIDTTNEKYVVKRGNFYFLNRYHQLTYYADSQNPYEKMFIVLYGDFVDSLVKNYGINDAVVVKKYDAEEFMTSILDLCAQTPIDYDKLALKVLEMFQIIFPSPYYVSETKFAVANKIREFIDNNIEKKLTLDILSEELYISIPHIERVFKETFYITPSKYIAQRKIDQVATLLLTTNYSIENIANRLGYTDAKYLSKCFKKAKGISPLQYRKQRIIE